MAGQPLWTMERGTLWVLDLAGALPPRVMPRIPVTFGEVSAEFSESLTRAMGLPTADEICRRQSTGRRCFAAWDGDQIVTYGWLSRGRECVGELEREFRFPPDDGYIWNCATLPAYRQQGLYSALVGYMAGQAREQGAPRVWIGAARANVSSWRGFARAGFQPAIELTYARFLSLRLTWISGSGAASADVVAAARHALATDHEARRGALAVALRGAACTLP